MLHWHTRTYLAATTAWYADYGDIKSMQWVFVCQCSIGLKHGNFRGWRSGSVSKALAIQTQEHDAIPRTYIWHHAWRHELIIPALDRWEIKTVDLQRLPLRPASSTWQSFRANERLCLQQMWKVPEEQHWFVLSFPCTCAHMSTYMNTSIQLPHIHSYIYPLVSFSY